MLWPIGLGWDAVEWFPFSQSGIQARWPRAATPCTTTQGWWCIPEYDMAAAVV